jgi:multisubunit Na+/H+ antiporter MnhB subunit
MRTDGSFIPYAVFGIVMYVVVIVYRLTTGKWMGKRGQERLEVAGALLLLALLIGVTLWYS